MTRAAGASFEPPANGARARQERGAAPTPLGRVATRHATSQRAATTRPRSTATEARRARSRENGQSPPVSARRQRRRRRRRRASPTAARERDGRNPVRCGRAVLEQLPLGWQGKHRIELVADRVQVSRVDHSATAPGLGREAAAPNPAPHRVGASPHAARGFLDRQHIRIVRRNGGSRFGGAWAPDAGRPLRFGLSRVKRDERDSGQPPEQGRLF